MALHSQLLSSLPVGPEQSRKVTALCKYYDKRTTPDNKGVFVYVRVSHTLVYPSGGPDYVGHIRVYVGHTQVHPNTWVDTRAHTPYYTKQSLSGKTTTTLRGSTKAIMNGFMGTTSGAARLETAHMPRGRYRTQRIAILIP